MPHAMSGSTVLYRIYTVATTWVVVMVHWHHSTWTGPWHGRIILDDHILELLTGIVQPFDSILSKCISASCCILQAVLGACVLAY